MPKTFTVARDVTPKEWSPLPRAFKAGETLYETTETTYGIDRDDAVYGGYETIACCEQPGQPFFTVLVDLLRLPDGTQPTGPYASVARRTRERLSAREAGEAGRG